jgi:hypothetical protein
MFCNVNFVAFLPVVYDYALTYSFFLCEAALCAKGKKSRGIDFLHIPHVYSTSTPSPTSTTPLKLIVLLLLMNLHY